MDSNNQAETWETASTSQELSPTDGYFADRRHPRELYVETASSSTSYPKEHESRQEQSQSSSSRPEPLSPTYTDEHTPLLHQGVPPPAYSYAPPIVSSLAGARRPSNGRYYDIPFSVHRSSLQDMGGPPDSGEQKPSNFPMHRRWIRSVRPRYWLSEGKRYLLGFCTLLLAIWLVVASTKAGQIRKYFKEGAVLQAPGTEQPAWPSHCQAASFRELASFDFTEPPSFHLTEAIHNDPRNTGGVSGRIHLLPAPSSQAFPIQVNITFESTIPFTLGQSYYTQTKSDLHIKTPELRLPYGSLQQPCIVLHVYVYLHPDIRLQELNITSNHLSVSIHKSQNLTTDTTTVDLQSGNLYASPFNSRETRISIGSGSISGSYNLYDLLSLHTKSGSITTDIIPKVADKDSEKPARFDAGSMSGGIDIKFNTLNLPDRDYRTTVKSDFGSITGTFVHGTETYIRSDLGTINADILPYAADDYESDLFAGSKSGMQKITLHSPYKDAGTVIRRMSSTHETHYGNLNLVYPQEWEGRISGGTRTGRLNLKGKDVRIIEEGGGWLGKSVKAKKGDGNSTLEFHTMSGSVDVTVGAP